MSGGNTGLCLDYSERGRTLPCELWSPSANKGERSRKPDHTTHALQPVKHHDVFMIKAS